MTSNASSTSTSSRLVTTTTGADGVSRIHSDTQVPGFSPFGPGKSTFQVFHSTSTVPTTNTGDPTFPAANSLPRCHANGVIFCASTIPPGAVAPMHRTLSLDYAYIESGEICLSLDGGEETTLRAGDVLCQRGVNHSWMNKSDVPCRMIFVMVASEKIKLADGTVLEETAVLAVILPACLAQEPQKHIPFSMGDLVDIECPVILSNGTLTTEYVPLHCADSGVQKSNAPLQFPYGMDALLRCIWALDEGMYNMIKLSMEGKAAYSCRVPMSKDKTIFWPLTINFWGAIEDTHIHLMTHWNFVLHALEGFFLGGSVYPLRDHWVLAPPGGFIIIHGPVRWFAGHTFEGSVQGAQNVPQIDDKTIPAANKDEDSSEKAKQAERPGIAPKDLKPVSKEELPTVAALLAAVPPSVVMMYVGVSVGCTVGVAALLYISYLKPKLLETKKQK
ncbi:hypothetical protein HK101_006721 [Irineochytrium annulatum]|nr:hypothetical protein HK101_006721 [Irineochytrium annulatum]